MLWNEYKFVFGGERPAKTFTKEERGANRFNYYKRNIFWSLVVEMVKRGCSLLMLILFKYGGYSRVPIPLDGG